jgi:phage gp45-like
MVVGITEGGLWQLLGHDDEVDEDVPVFQGIGFASRPSATSVTGGRAEAVLLHVAGASSHPVIVATRDESIRVELDEDETAIFNGSSIVKVKADGTIEIGSQGGTFVPLALKSDVQAIKTVLTTWTVVPTDGGGALKTKAINDLASIPAGTTKLKAE